MKIYKVAHTEYCNKITIKPCSRCRFIHPHPPLMPCLANIPPSRCHDLFLPFSETASLSRETNSTCFPSTPLRSIPNRAFLSFLLVWVPVALINKNQSENALQHSSRYIPSASPNTSGFGGFSAFSSSVARIRTNHCRNTREMHDIATQTRRMPKLKPTNR